MSVFNISGTQTAGRDINNVAGDLNIGAVQNGNELSGELEKLKQMLAAARQAGDISEDTETEAKYHITKAAQVAKAPEPDKKSLLDYISAAKNCLDGIDKVGSIVAALATAAGVVQRLF